MALEGRSDASPLDVGGSATLAQGVQFLVVVAAFAITQRATGPGLSGGADVGGAIVIAFGSGQHFGGTAGSDPRTVGGYGVRLGASIVHHGGQLPTASVDEPVGDLVCGGGENTRKLALALCSGCSVIALSPNKEF